MGLVAHAVRQSQPSLAGHRTAAQLGARTRVQRPQPHASQTPMRLCASGAPPKAAKRYGARGSDAEQPWARRMALRGERGGWRCEVRRVRAGRGRSLHHHFVQADRTPPSHAAAVSRRHIPGACTTSSRLMGCDDRAPLMLQRTMKVRGRPRGTRTQTWEAPP